MERRARFGFTELSSRLPAPQLVELLNAVFRRFDDPVQVQGLEKITTIGDANMAVAGAPVACDDHADRAAAMALAMLPALDDVARQSGHALQLRIGLHSGPVAAGVIGKRKFAYDLLRGR